MVHIRVVKDSGRTLSASETILRNLMRIVDQLPSLYAVGILSALLTAQNQRLGDLLAGSIVVREASLAEMRPVWDIGAAASSIGMGQAQLSVEDLALIEAFLARRSELPGDVRWRMASGILERLQARSQVKVDRGMSAESALETLAQEVRSRNSYL